MSASPASLVNTCNVCGAEETLDALLQRMIDDDQVRRLIAQVVTQSLPLGGLVVRYLRLHKPPKHKLRLEKVARLLGELVPDMQRNVIERNGRHWAIGGDGWRAAFQAVFDAVDKNTLALPLEGNSYLYGCLVRIADQNEGQDERAAEQAQRGRAHKAGATAVQALLANAQAAPAVSVASAPPTPRAIAPTGPKAETPLVRQIKAEIAAKAAFKAGAAPTAASPESSTEEKGVTHE